MKAAEPELPDQSTSPSTPAAVQDRRRLPKGALPRQLQTWLMVAVAGLMLLIILITGHATPPEHVAKPDRTPTATAAPTERIRGFERQLADDEARLREMSARPTEPGPMPAATATATSLRPSPTPISGVDSGLAADNIAFSLRAPGLASRVGGIVPSAGAGAAPAGQTNGLDTWLRAMAELIPHSAGASPAPPPPTTAVAAATTGVPAERSAAGSESSPSGRERIAEGSVIEAVLLNRLDGTFTGPVTALVTSPVYSHDRQRIIVPAGARVLGEATAVQTVGESRLAVAFHRLILPDGRAYSLDRFTGLSQVGETGLRDQVNRHYLQAFGASLAIGALSGLAQMQTRTGLDMTFADIVGQGAGASLATSATRILDRFLNVLPTITIREGYRLKVYVTNDLFLPAYDVRLEGGR